MRRFYLVASIFFAILALGTVGPTGTGSVVTGLLCAHVSGLWLGGFLLSASARGNSTKEKT